MLIITMSLVAICCVFGLLFWAPVICLSEVNEISEKEAKKIVKNLIVRDLKKLSVFIKKIIAKFFKKLKAIIAVFFIEVFKWLKENPTQIITYPLCLGYNGVQYVMQEIDDEFAEIRSNFEVCYCVNVLIAPDQSYITYQFSIQRKKNSPPDSELEIIIQKQAEKLATYYLNRADIMVIAEPLVLVELQVNHLYITFALKPSGIEKISVQREVIRRSRIEQEKKNEAGSFTEGWGDEQMAYGYQKKQYDEYGIALPITLPIESHPMVLLTGSSGSGKSQALMFLIGRLLQEKKGSLSVWVCDFKKSEDYAFLEDYPNYFAGKECYDGIMEFYEKFSTIRERGRNYEDKRHLLIVDEYPSLINHLQMQDKMDKTKRASDILRAISEILMLGRGTGAGFGLWIVTQRADASLFANGARDDFMVICGLGRMSREQKGMLFAGQDLPEDTIYSAGEGILLADGKELTEVKFPLIKDLRDWQEHILDILMDSYELEL